jgi:HEAT repeat protein
LALAAAKTKDPEVIPTLLELLEDGNVVGHAAAGLGMLRAKAAIPKLKEIAETTDNAWIRREAKTALRRLGVT